MGFKENREYENFWKPIIENPDGSINKDQLMKELSDYSWLMEAASKVYSEVTNCKTGNVRVLPDVIIGLNEECISDAINEHEKETVKEILEMIEEEINNNRNLVKELKNTNSWQHGQIIGTIDGLMWLMDKIKERYE